VALRAFVLLPASVLYDFLSANRISLGNALDGIIAAKRVNM
jgi:hypothetical protein